VPATSQPGQNPHSPGPLPRRTLRRGRLSGQCGWPAVHSLVRRPSAAGGTGSTSCGRRRCPVPRAMRRPSGSRRCSTWPACHPENRHRAAACRTANSYQGRPSPSNSGHWPEGPSNPAGGPPTGLRELPARPISSGPATSTAAGATGGTALASSTPIPRRRRAPAQQFGGRQGGRGRNGSAGSRCPNRTPRPRRSPPGPQPATPSSPAPTRQRDRHRRVAAGESQLFERQRSTHPVLAERGRPVHQHLTGGAVLPAHPPRQPPLHRDPDLRELGQHPRPRLGAIRSLFIPPLLDRNEIGSTVTNRKSVPTYETAARSARNGRRSRGARQRAPVRPAVCSAIRPTDEARATPQRRSPTRR